MWALVNFVAFNPIIKRLWLHYTKITEYCMLIRVKICIIVVIFDIIFNFLPIINTNIHRYAFILTFIFLFILSLLFFPFIILQFLTTLLHFYLQLLINNSIFNHIESMLVQFPKSNQSNKPYKSNKPCCSSSNSRNPSCF